MVVQFGVEGKESNMYETDLAERFSEVRLYLAWEHQGRLWWDDDWLERHGPTRTHIPGMDDQGLPRLWLTPEL
jgi:hypothetical protein